MKDVAIVTLAIGEQHLADWKKYCAADWQAYAHNCGYDLIVVTEPIDRSPRAAARSPSWQKCLVLGQDFARSYRQIVLLDSDIAINAQAAPRITEQVPPERIGGVISGSHLHEDLRVVLLNRLRQREYAYQRGLAHWQQDQNGIYWKCGLGHLEAGIVQGGVLVANPALHGELFQLVYSTGYERETRGFEQIPLSHAILSSGQFQAIDTRFNSVFFETAAVHYPYLLNKNAAGYDELARQAVVAQYLNNFFLHFAYDPGLIRFLQD